MKRIPVILQIIPHLDAGGAELSTLEIVEALVRVGARALVATQGGRLAGEVERLGGTIIPMEAATKNPLMMYRNKQLLESLLEEYKVDVLHARSRAPAWSSLLASMVIKVPFVTTYHGAYGEMEPFKRLYNSVMARGDLVIANSKFTADLVRRRHGTDEKRLRIVYRGVDLKKFSQEAVSRDRMQGLREKWGISRDKKIILHPARLTRWKGQGNVIEAMGKLLERGAGENAIAVLAGDHQGRDDYRLELQNQIAKRGLQDRVRLVGHCSDMAAAYALAHVTIIASTAPEAFGRTSAEAQALGGPVIATNIGAPPETVLARPFVPRQQITGWLVPPEEPGALASALASALAMERLEYEQLAKRARQNVEENFSDRNMKIRTLAIYDELLQTDLSARYRELV